MTLELHTGGFYAVHEPSGSVRVFVPGFDVPQEESARRCRCAERSSTRSSAARCTLGTVEALGPCRLRGARPGRDRARGNARPARRDGARRPSRAFSPAGPARSRRARDGSPRRRRLPRRGRRPATVEISPLRFDASRGGSSCCPASCAVRLDVRRARSRASAAWGTGAAAGPMATKRRARRCSRGSSPRSAASTPSPSSSSSPDAHAGRWLLASRSPRSSRARRPRPFHVEPQGSHLRPRAAGSSSSPTRAPPPPPSPPRSSTRSSRRSGGTTMSVVAGVPSARRLSPPRRAGIVRGEPELPAPTSSTSRTCGSGSPWSERRATEPFALDGLDSSSPETALSVFLQGGSDAG